MKATKGVKKILLKGFEKMLDLLQASEEWVQISQYHRNEEDIDFWTNQRRDYQIAILKGIEGLIEGKTIQEKSQLERSREILDKFWTSEGQAKYCLLREERELGNSWRQVTTNYRNTILKEIGDLIEEEGEQNGN